MFRIKKNVFGLNVSVADPFLMEVTQCIQKLIKYRSEIFFRHAWFEVRVREVFHYYLADPLSGLNKKGLVFDDCFVLELPNVDKVCL